MRKKIKRKICTGLALTIAAWNFLKIFIPFLGAYPTMPTSFWTKKTVLFDTADWSVCRQFLENVEAVLAGRPLDYLIVNHVEPDHSGSLPLLAQKCPNATFLITPQAPRN